MGFWSFVGYRASVCHGRLDAQADKTRPAPSADGAAPPAETDPAETLPLGGRSGWRHHPDESELGLS